MGISQQEQPLSHSKSDTKNTNKGLIFNFKYSDYLNEEYSKCLRLLYNNI